MKYWIAVPASRRKPVLILSSIGNSQPYAITSDGEWVWFGNYGNGTVRRVSVHGMGTEVDLAVNQVGPSEMVAEPGWLYWTNYAEESVNGAIMKVQSEGGKPPIILAHSQQQPWGIALDSDYVYWANYVVSGTVSRVPKSGGATEILADKLSRPAFVAVDEVAVYWTTRQGLMRLAK